MNDNSRTLKTCICLFATSYTVTWRYNTILGRKNLVITRHLYFWCSDFSPSDAIYIWTLVWTSHFTSCTISEDTLAQASVIHSWRSRTPDVGDISTGKYPLESAQLNVNTYRNHHIRLCVSWIPPQGFTGVSIQRYFRSCLANTFTVK